MSVIRYHRQRRRIASTALALFVAVWLNMAIQPCLMAAEPLLSSSSVAVMTARQKTWR